MGGLQFEFNFCNKKTYPIGFPGISFTSCQTSRCDAPSLGSLSSSGKFYCQKNIVLQYVNSFYMYSRVSFISHMKIPSPYYS